MPLVIDWVDSIISVTSPTTEVDAQTLHDFIEDVMATPVGELYDDILQPEGKIEDPTNPGVYSQIIMIFNSPWQIQFWGGSGYTRIYGGKLVGGLNDQVLKATGTAGDISVLESPVDGVTVVVEGSSLSPEESEDLAAAAAGAADASLARKLLSNRAVIAPDDLSVTLYDDDGTTELLTFDVSEDKRERSVPQLTEHYWEPMAGVDGADYDTDADNLVYRKTSANDTISHATVDSTPVMRVTADELDNGWKRSIVFNNFPQFSTGKSWRWSGKAYFDGTWWLGTEMYCQGNQGYLFQIIKCETGDFKITAQGWAGYPLMHSYNNITGPTRSWSAPGWVEWAFEYHTDGTYRIKAWQPPGETEPAGWDVEQTDHAYDPLDKATFQLQFAADDINSNMDIAWIKVEEI